MGEITINISYEHKGIEVLSLFGGEDISFVWDEENKVWNVEGENNFWWLSYKQKKGIQRDYLTDEELSHLLLKEEEICCSSLVFDQDIIEAVKELNYDVYFEEPDGDWEDLCVWEITERLADYLGENAYEQISYRKYRVKTDKFLERFLYELQEYIKENKLIATQENVEAIILAAFADKVVWEIFSAWPYNTVERGYDFEDFLDEDKKIRLENECALQDAFGGEILEELSSFLLRFPHGEYTKKDITTFVETYMKKYNVPEWLEPKNEFSFTVSEPVDIEYFSFVDEDNPRCVFDDYGEYDISDFISVYDEEGNEVDLYDVRKQIQELRKQKTKKSSQSNNKSNKSSGFKR